MKNYEAPPPPARLSVRHDDKTPSLCLKCKGMAGQIANARTQAEPVFVAPFDAHSESTLKRSVALRFGR